MPTNPRPLPPPWDRIFPTALRVSVWGALFFVLYILRSFFLLIFLTFVFSYIQAHFVRRISGWKLPRTLSVVVVALFFLSVIVGTGSVIIPKVKVQAELFASRYPTYIQGFDAELVKLSAKYPFLDRLTPELKNAQESFNIENGKFYRWEMSHSPTAGILQKFLGIGGDDSAGEDQVSIEKTMLTLRNIGAGLLASASAFLLSLLFSFLIVLDLPNLTKSIRSLASTKIGFIYDEVSESIQNFCGVLGRSLEAQLFVAIANTIFTAIGISLLGLGANLAFLSLIVFVCSFIPVAGVFVSSAPICLLALQEVGVHGLLLAIGLILLIHFIETYFLNPKIYGQHLKINPVLVLIILTIGGKLFQVWGLVLGLPICTYIFSHAIRNRKKSDNIT